ncbi:hypothetical protein GA0115253_106766, partial [Streptomyces sp. Termitarium-T10T-6]
MGKTFTTCRTDAVAPPSRFPLPERSALLMRERHSSSPDSGSAGKPQEENPFAAPPADRPDQPWQPRRPSRVPRPGVGRAGRQRLRFRFRF